MKNRQKFPPKLSELPQMLDWVRTQLAQTLLPDTEKKRVELALEEALVNVITHGKPTSDLTLICRFKPEQQIEFDLCDFGPPFNPLEHPENLERETLLEKREPGGLGLLLMRQSMDALLYRREEGQNVLTLIKDLPKSL